MSIPCFVVGWIGRGIAKFLDERVVTLVFEMRDVVRGAISSNQQNEEKHKGKTSSGKSNDGSHFNTIIVSCIGAINALVETLIKHEDTLKSHSQVQQCWPKRLLGFDS
jgi:hypothetical protein